LAACVQGLITFSFDIAAHMFRHTVFSLKSSLPWEKSVSLHQSFFRVFLMCLKFDYIIEEKRNLDFLFLALCGVALIYYFFKRKTKIVLQGLTVLEYLVAHGSERVIDEIKDHAYQLSVMLLLCSL